jgi:hypothetical protein
MAPRGDFAWFEGKLEETASREEIEYGSKAIFLVGTIVYDVVFEMASRVTNFCYYIGGDVGMDGHEMSAASDGNNAT